MICHISEVVEANYKASPETNKAGVKYPRHYARVKMPWIASVANPDPITPHPIPVFLNHFHGDQMDWQPLKPGTRVVVAPVDRSPINPIGLAVIAYGPQNTDDRYSDLRETVDYTKRAGNGGEDRYVNAPSDPVFGPNGDVGRTHLDSRGHGWQTRHPWPTDPNRDTSEVIGPSTVVLDEHRLDDTVVRWRVTHTGLGVVYTILADGVAKALTIKDDKGNSFVLNTASNDLILTLVRGISLAAVRLGFYGTTPITKPAVTGTKTAADGATTPALASLLTALADLGLITNSTT